MKFSFKSIKWGGMLMLLFAVTTAHAASPPANASGYLDNIATNFQTATTGWMTIAQGYAFNIFAGLAGLDLAWWGVKNVLKKNDLADFLTGATLKIASLAFFYTIIKEAPTWMPLIVQSFTQMGQKIGGPSVTSLTPSGIIGQAFSVNGKLYDAIQAAPSGFSHISDNILLSLIIAVTSIMVMIGFSLVALQLLMTLIESSLVGGAGLVMLGFTGSGLTSTFGEKYIGYMLSIGVKLLTIYAIAGLGGHLIDNEISYINALMAAASAKVNPVPLHPLDLLSVGASMLVYGTVGMQVPGLAASLMNGSPSMTLGNVAGGAAGIVGGVAGAGAAAVAGAAGVMGAAQSGLDKLAGLVGGGGGGVTAGGIGGASKLEALGSMTGASGPGGGSAAGGIGGASKNASPGGVGGSISSGGQMGGGGPTSGAAGAQTSASGASSKGKSDAGNMGNAPTNSAPAPTPSAGPTTPATGGADMLGAPDTAQNENDNGGKAEKGEDKSPWSVMKDGLGQAAGIKDDISRHEGGGGSGIQIRLGHSE